MTHGEVVFKYDFCKYPESATCLQDHLRRAPHCPSAMSLHESQPPIRPSRPGSSHLWSPPTLVGRRRPRPSHILLTCEIGPELRSRCRFSEHSGGCLPPLGPRYSNPLSVTRNLLLVLSLCPYLCRLIHVPLSSWLSSPVVQRLSAGRR